jgi:hypothetical protein
MPIPFKPPSKRTGANVEPSVTIGVALGVAHRRRAVTVRAIVAVWLSVPDLPVIVTVNVPTGAEALAASVTTIVPAVPPGANDAVTPLDRPDTVRFTLLLKPFSAVPVIVLAPLLPCAMLRLAGDTERVKSGGAVIVSNIVALLVSVLRRRSPLRSTFPSQPKRSQSVSVCSRWLCSPG